MNYHRSRRNTRGTSLVEMFLIVSLVAAFVTIGFTVFDGLLGSAKQTKLMSDIKTLNSAVLSYVAANGDLTSAKTPKDVIAALKRDSSNNRQNGLRGSFLDNRIGVELQSEEDAADGSLRAYWDVKDCRFTVATSGPPGIKGFFFESADGSRDDQENTESRSSFMMLAEEDKWIWDYVEVTPTPLAGPSIIPTASVPPSSAAPVPVARAAPVPTIMPLATPIFSVPPSRYPFTDFNLSVTLLNPNPAGSSDIYFRVGYGSWNRYTGSTISVTPDTVVHAQAIAIDTLAYENSALVRGNYEAGPIQLAPPLITPDYSEFSLFGDIDINVSLVDTNSPGAAILEFRLDGGPWMEYSGPFILPAANFPNGADVEARAVSSGSPYYLTSAVSLEYIPLEAINLSGNTIGSYSNPQGPGGMVTNLNSGNSSSYFEWGDVNGNSGSESWMEFYGGSFTDIIDGQQFNVGSMTYYNGTINSGTGADTVDLEISLDLDLNGRTYRPYFDFTFELINTVNTNDEIASADFVYLNDARSSRTIVFDGYEFEFEILFGETTANGFSQFDRFNVIENRDASVNLYGKFNLLGPATDPGAVGNPTVGGLIIDDDPDTGDAGDILYQKIGYADPEQQIKSLLPIVKALAESAKDSRDTAINDEEVANKASQDLLSKVDEDKFYEAYLLYQKASEAAASAEMEAAKAEGNALEAQPYSAEAKSLALNDPRSVDEALKVTDEVNATALHAQRARDAATAARGFADNAAMAWNSAIANAGSNEGGLEALAAYYAKVADAEKSLTKTASENAVRAADDAISAASEMIRKIGEGKYLEAESFYHQIAPAALLARNGADAAEDTAARARAAANEANRIASQENGAEGDARKALKSADEAQLLAFQARSESDLATAASIDADSQWDNLLTNSPTAEPEAYATYLADKANAAENLAKTAREDAKSASEAAIKGYEDSAKKLLEGKPFEAQTLAEEAADFLANAQFAASLAQSNATEARSLAVQAGVIATADSVANDAYDKAMQSADNSETYSQEAAQFANEAADAAP